MYSQKKCIAMLLAGGQGSRLYALTAKVAKPAVSFGAKYRIIDFTLSNCVNSNIDTVGVLTQYQPLILNDYIGNGQPWDLDRTYGGVHISPPYQAKTGSEWYKGTANAIYQNLSFIENYDPEHVLILSGDHIYKMDYNLMLNNHIKNNADCTIAVLEVPMEEASRFGIMNTDEDGNIVEFEEKPAQPKSNLASMGIYIFNWKLLRKELIADMKVEGSSHDFGKDIIPSYLNQGKKLVAWRFEGYWKDVGTIDSLWEANMDLLNKSSELNLDDPTWKIYTEDIPALPEYIGPNGKVEHSYVNQGAVILGHAKESVISNGVTIEEGAIVEQSVLLPGVTVGAGAKVYKALVADNIKIDADTKVGSLSSKEVTLVAKHVKKGG